MWAREVLLTPHGDRFAQRGVVGAAYGVVPGEVEQPVVVLLQLWCFRDLDTAGSWLDRAVAWVDDQPNDRCTVHVGDYAESHGERLPATFLDPAIRSGWIQVRRLPVAPALGLGHPTITLTDERAYEIVGPADEHWVPFLDRPTTGD